jgi:formate hydrogenlyase transcriptional activator
MNRILIVDDNSHNIQYLANLLTEYQYPVEYVTNGKDALEWLSQEQFNLILLDIMMPEMDGMTLCKKIKGDKNLADIPVIFLTARTDIETITLGFESGGADFIIKPYNSKELLARIKLHLDLSDARQQLKTMNVSLEENVARKTKELVQLNKDLTRALEEITRLKNQLQQENLYLIDEIKSTVGSGDMISKNPALLKVFIKIKQVACTDATVLILGETGTGKELVARAIHRDSPRNKKSLIKLNCAAIPYSLIESELFGHEKGSFTGAIAQKPGRFELADNGTLFLDEIGELPIDLQSKLLRVLQEGEFERIGGTSTIKVNVRIIAATNRNLEEMIKTEKFRSDLYYRLNVFPVKLPPLRERTEDIPLLVKHFVGKFNTKYGKSITRIAPSFYKQLTAYSWPGNIRELENIIERAAILSVDDKLIESAIQRETFSEDASPHQGITLSEQERDIILKVLNDTNWRISGESGAAKILGIKSTTLEAKMKKLGITRKKN